MIPLEDNFNDVIGKAQRGLKLGDDELAGKSGISIVDLVRAKEGQVDEPVLRKIAPALNLNSAALLALARKSWYPRDYGEIPGLAMLTTPYHDITVNSFIVWDPQTQAAVFFDTGADATEMIQMAATKNLKVSSILLTHTHPDHIADLKTLKSATGAKAYVSELEPIEGAESFAEGRKFTIGNIHIETRQTSGHSRGGITYVVSGLSKPVAVVGDSIFASSMGGGNVSFEDALRNNRQKILTLSDDTVLCPGHGPLTTVGEEKEHNPFFARTG